jgi:hypothetical protein
MEPTPYPPSPPLSGSPDHNLYGNHNNQPSFDEEEAVLREHSTFQQAPGQEYYLVDFNWFEKWQAWVQGQGDACAEMPGAIPNENLTSEKTADPADRYCYPRVSKSLVIGFDYTVTTQSVWQHLVHWYGGGPEICRPCVHSNFGPTLAVHPFRLEVAKYATGPTTRIEVCKASTVLQMRVQACAALGIEDSDELAVFEVLFGTCSDEPLAMDSIAAEVITDQGTFVIQAGAGAAAVTASARQYGSSPAHSSSAAISSPPRGGADGSGVTTPVQQQQQQQQHRWTPSRSGVGGGDDDKDDPSSPVRSPGRSCAGTRRLWSLGRPSAIMNSCGNRFARTSGGGALSGSSASSSSDWNSDSSQPALDSTRPGDCGLTNLGNTCFMASGLQCLAHAQPIREYFLSREPGRTSSNYEAELNRDNPLGCKGEMALAFGSIMERMHSGRYSSLAPREFKRSLEQCAPQFSGYAQHDSQEFLNFLLDGLHEDLNRCRVKPQTSPVELSADQDEDQVALEAWQVHRQRNDSVIVDTIQGQYRSTVRCPEPHCGKVSVTFDPFMILSIPLPPSLKQVELTLVFKHGTKQPVELRLRCADVADLRAQVGRRFSIPTENLFLTEMFNGKVYKEFDPAESLSKIMAGDKLVMYELAHVKPPVNDEHATGFTYRPLSKNDHRVAVVTVTFKQPRSYSTGWSTSHSDEKMGSPLVLTVLKESYTVRELFAHIDAHVDRVLKGQLREWCAGRVHPADDRSEAENAAEAATADSGGVTKRASTSPPDGPCKRRRAADRGCDDDEEGGGARQSLESSPEGTPPGATAP